MKTMLSPPPPASLKFRLFETSRVAMEHMSTRECKVELAQVDEGFVEATPNVFQAPCICH